MERAQPAPATRMAPAAPAAPPAPPPAAPAAPRAAPALPAARRRRRWLTRTDLWGYLFISPWAVGFLVFTLFPFAASLYLSLTNWEVVGDWGFVGLNNFSTLMSGSDKLFNVDLVNNGG